MHSHICHIINHLGAGGAEQYVVQLSNYLNRQSHRVTIVAGQPQVLRERLDVGVRVETIELHPGANRSIWKYLPSLYSSCKNLIRYFKSARVTIVHTHLAASAFPAWVAARWCGIPVIHSRMYVGNLGSRFEKLLFFTRIPLLLVSRVVVFTRYSEREVGQQWHIPTERVISSSIGVDVTKYSDIRSSSNFYRAELGVSRDDRVILVVARLHPEKDVELAIRAALALNDPGTLLLIVGDGQERNRLEQLVAELPGGTRIRFLGLMQDPRPAYAAADILLQTSRSPNLGTVVLEAMASGLPVVIAYRDSSEFLMALDTFDGDDIGVIAEATADDLARAISTLSADPGKIEKLRTRVHNFVEVRHAQEVVYSKLLDDYTYLENLTH